MRHIESPELFGVGIGSGTSGDITCGICGAAYNQGADKSGRYMDNDSVTHTTFAGIDVCDCCFEKVEDEIEHRMPDILRWYRAIINQRRADVARDVKLLDDIGLERPLAGKRNNPEVKP